MKLYTSYFAQLRNFPRDLVGLSTAVWNPKWRPMGKDKRGVICVDCPPFKPGKQCEGLCCGKCNPKQPEDCAFLRVYKEQLDKIHPNTVLNNLARLSDQIGKDEELTDIDFAFLVYETPQNPCSERIMIQKWCKENGIEIKEWQPQE